MASSPERTLLDGLKRGKAVTLPLAALGGARRVLEMLAEDGAGYRVEACADDVEVMIEVGNGLVVGAVADRAGRRLEGPDAYALMREVRRGEVTVSPLKFPSLANILEPVAELPELASPSSLPPAIGADTVELSIPEARPVHVVPEPTEEIELPPELRVRRQVSSIPPPPPREPTPEVAEGSGSAAVRVPSAILPPSAALPQPLPRAGGETSPDVTAPATPIDVSPVKPAPRSRRAWPWMAAAASALLLVGAGAAVYAATGPEEAPTPVATGPQVIDTPEPTVEDEQADEADEGDARTDRAARRERARRLAREARRLLREGRARQALPRAQRAARLRRHLPYYQVVLGDALAANGRRAAARRAWRRALRMRPNYAPALQRLGRQRSELASRVSHSERG